MRHAVASGPSCGRTRRWRWRPPRCSVAAPPAARLPAQRSLGESVRADFPILHQEVSGHPLVYLDSAATSQKPVAVLEAVRRYYERDNANVHRGVHTLAARATTAFEDARETVARFVCGRPDEVVFTRGATEALNLVAWSWGSRLGPGDEVALSPLEHHSNLVPWQLLARRTGCTLRFAPLDGPGGVPSVDAWASVVGPRTRLVATAHVSNVLASTAPVASLVEMARAVGALVLLDGCQSVPSRPTDVAALGVDFLVASGHKMCAPTGTGFLWARAEVLADMAPWQGGGEMIDTVTLHGATYAPPPSRFEAGTPNIGGAVGLGAACDYLTSLGMGNVAAHEEELGFLLYDALRSAVPGLTVLGPARGRAGLCAFSVAGCHPTDVSTLADAQGVALRSGHHCAQPLHEALGLAASCRASGYVYTTRGEVERAAEVVKDAVAFLRAAA